MPIDTICRGGDLRNFLGPVVDRNREKWRRYIFAIVKNEADADDVIQEAVRRVLSRNKLLASSEEVKMYLNRAIGNAALELYNNRKRERLKHVPLVEKVSLPADNNGCPETPLEEKELAAEKELRLKLVREGLQRLPAKYFEALRITILDSPGLSLRNAGNTHGIPYSTLRHRNRQGIRLLRKYINHAMKKETNGRQEKCGGKTAAAYRRLFRATVRIVRRPIKT
ncbi:MAG TPA: sigma-70 family RNA polymerase sigma factor [Acidobacteriota bacterium]|nr:sigma-70 family RNA polymerase sigma factor [Acidobacteriota bacterium]